MSAPYQIMADQEDVPTQIMAQQKDVPTQIMAQQKDVPTQIMADDKDENDSTLISGFSAAGLGIGLLSILLVAGTIAWIIVSMFGTAWLYKAKKSKDYSILIVFLILGLVPNPLMPISFLVWLCVATYWFVKLRKS